tara:strand:+ start:1771 stop:2034 length:264 start_codon:yes stop_codon:yes gene_type:complete
MSKHSSVLKVLAFIFLLGVIAIFGNFNNDKAFGIISDFLAIMTGFTITALSIIATSKFSSELYGIEDEKDNYKLCYIHLFQSLKTHL